MAVLTGKGQEGGQQQRTGLGLSLPISPPTRTPIPASVGVRGVSPAGGGVRVSQGGDLGRGLASIGDELKGAMAKREKDRKEKEAINQMRVNQVRQHVDRLMAEMKEAGWRSADRKSREYRKLADEGKFFTQEEMAKGVADALVSQLPGPEAELSLYTQAMEKYGMPEDKIYRKALEDRVAALSGGRESAELEDAVGAAVGAAVGVEEAAGRILRDRLGARGMARYAKGLYGVVDALIVGTQGAKSQYEANDVVAKFQTGLIRKVDEIASTRKAGVSAVETFRGGTKEAGGEYARNLMNDMLLEYAGKDRLGLLTEEAANEVIKSKGILEVPQFQEKASRQRGKFEGAGDEEVRREGHLMALNLLKKSLGRTKYGDATASEMTAAASLLVPGLEGATDRLSPSDLLSLRMSPEQKYIVGEIARAIVEEGRTLGIMPKREGGLFRWDYELLNPQGKEVYNEAMNTLWLVSRRLEDDFEGMEGMMNVGLKIAEMWGAGDYDPRRLLEIPEIMETMRLLSPEGEKEVQRELAVFDAEKAGFPLVLSSPLSEGFGRALEESGGDPRKSWEPYLRELEEYMERPMVEEDVLGVPEELGFPLDAPDVVGMGGGM